MTSSGEATTATVDPTRVVDPTYAWTLAVAPLIYALLPFAFPEITAATALGVAVIANSVLALLDVNRVNKAGADVNVLWALFLVPVYLVLRTKKVGSTPAVPIVWVGAFLTSLVVANATAVPGSVEFNQVSLETQLEDQIEAQYGERPQVDCPDGMTMATVGDPFPCAGEAQDGYFSVYVTITDGDGAYSWQITQ